MLSSVIEDPSGPPPSTKTNPDEVLCLLEGLLGVAEPSKMTEAVRNLPRELSLRASVERACLLLGVELLEVTLPASELRTSGIRLPVLDVTSELRVVLEARRTGQLVREASGRTATVAVSNTDERPRTYWIVSNLQPLSVLAHRVGLARLRSYLKLEGPLVKYVLLFAVGVEVLGLAVPLTVQVLINTIGFGMLAQPLLILSLLLLLSLAGAAGFRLLQMLAIEHLVRRFVERVAIDFGNRLGRLDGYPEKKGFPSHRFFEVASVDKAFFVLGLDFISLVLQVGAATVLLSVYHPILLGFALALIAAAWLAIHIPFRTALKHSYAESSAKYALGAWLAHHPRGERLTGRQHLGEWLEARKRAFRLAFAQQAGLFLVQVVFSAGLLLLGGRLVIAGQLTLGQLVAAELVTTTALVSLGKVGKQIPKIYDLVTSLEKIGRIVDLPLGEDQNRDLEDAA